MLKWLAIIGAVTGTVFVAKRLLAGEARPGIDYEVDMSQRYGKVWGNQRPPGLPANARYAGVDEGAAPYIASVARSEGLGESFVRAMLALADKESSMTFGRPANNFNMAGTGDTISAWGVFQWNEDAWDRLGERRDYIDARFQREPVAPSGALRRYPWEQTAYEEIAWPIAYYARIWRTIQAHGGDDLAAARGVFIWHSGPTRLRRYIETAERYGWRGGWEELGQDLSGDWPEWYRDKTASIDRRLTAVGIV